MAIILKSKTALPAEPVIYRFEDVAGDARRIIDEARAEAEHIVAEAQAEADAIRLCAAEAGQAAARQAARQEMQLQLESVLPAVSSIARQLEASREEWLEQWQKNTIQLATKIAERIVRRELDRAPSITLTYVREALEMCAAAPQVRVLLHPEDAQSLGEAAAQIVREIMPAAHAEIVADETISAGGCRIETRHGEIDQQLETQLKRIEAELAGI